MKNVQISPSARQKAPGIPTFALYGESGAAEKNMLHVEDVQSRSERYQWEIEPHVHLGLFQVLWLQLGSAEVLLDEHQSLVHALAALVVPPGVVHGFRFVPGTNGIVLTLSAPFLLEGEFQSVGEAFRDLFLQPAVLKFDPVVGAGARVSALFQALLAEFVLPDAAASPVPVWLARALVWHLSKACARGQRVSNQRAYQHQALFTRFLLLVEQHFLEHWPLERYASRLGLSIPRLNRLIRVERGVTALELVHERLTREACRRLIYVAVPAARLAAELGFDDPAYFSRFFKRRTGQSPQSYRAAHAGAG